MLAIMGSIVLAMFSYPALSQTSPIAPNGITFINNTNTFSANRPGTVYVQLLYNGQNLRSEGVRVYFLSKNTDVIPAGLGTYTLTDANGTANLTFTANVTGDTNLTATAMGPDSGIAATQTFHIIAGAIPTPVFSTTPTPSAAATGAPTTTPMPSPAPTANPTYTATPSATPATGDINSQAFGIIGVGIVLAIIMIAAAFVARKMGKK